MLMVGGQSAAVEDPARRTRRYVYVTAVKRRAAWWRRTIEGLLQRRAERERRHFDWGQMFGKTPLG